MPDVFGRSGNLSFAAQRSRTFFFLRPFVGILKRRMGFSRIKSV
jgi:hypothetical protein